MSPFKSVPHMADSGIHVSGRDIEDLIISAMRGMFSIAGVRKPAKKKVERGFKIKGNDTQSLLINLLNDALSLSDIHKEMYNDIKFKKLTPNTAEGKFIGAPVESFELVIKGVTHHNLKITKKNNLLETTILFDV